MKKVLARFTVYDLVIISVMAALGIAIKPIVVPLAHLISGPLMIPSGALAGGLYMMWLVVGYGIIRKPGTATLIGLIQALLVLLTGIIGSHGVMSLLTYTLPGLLMDLILVITGHRVCCRGCAFLAGAVANVAGTLCVNYMFFKTPGLYLIIVCAVALLSGGIGGIIAWELIRVMEKYHLSKKFSRKEKLRPTEMTKKSEGAGIK